MSVLHRARDYGLQFGYGWENGMFSLDSEVTNVRATLQTQNAVVSLTREIQVC